MRKNHIVGLLVAIGLSACRQNLHHNTGEAIPYVRVVHPEMAPVRDTIIATGLITTIDQSDLSFKTGGTVEEVYVKEGDFVKKGQLLARLNTAEYKSQIDQIDYKISQYMRDIKRLQVLVKDTIATLEQLQNTETALATTRAQRGALAYNLDQAAIHAPADGVILVKQVNKGEYKPSGALAFTLGSNEGRIKSHWIFKTSLSDRDRLRIRVNERAILTLDALPERPLEGVVYRLSTIPDPVTLTYDCYIRFDPGQAPVVYGLSGKLALPAINDQSFTLLPLEAVTQVNDGVGIIYTVSGRSLARRSKVKLISIRKDKAVLYTPLDPAERVIIAGNDGLEDGQKVQIENARY